MARNPRSQEHRLFSAVTVCIALLGTGTLFHICLFGQADAELLVLLQLFCVIGAALKYKNAIAVIFINLSARPLLPNLFLCKGQTSMHCWFCKSTLTETLFAERKMLCGCYIMDQESRSTLLIYGSWSTNGRNAQRRPGAAKTAFNPKGVEVSLLWPAN